MASRNSGKVRKNLPLKALLESAPVRTVGRFNREADPWNLLFIGEESQVVGALKGAGWTRIPLSVPLSLRLGLGELLRGKRPTLFPPMNLYRVGGAVQDHNWGIVVRPITARHHFRLWRLPQNNEQGRPYWWGSGNYDLDARYRDLSHIPSPDMVAEREYIADSLKGSKWVESAARVSARRIPRAGKNDKGYPFKTDGRVLVVRLTRKTGGSKDR